MNKDSIVKCVADVTVYDKYSGRVLIFKKGKEYKVLAGLGDGNLARTDNKVGAFITSPSQMCLMAENGFIRLTSFNPEVFVLVKEVENKYPKRVVANHVYKPNNRSHRQHLVVHGEFTAADAS